MSALRAFRLLRVFKLLKHWQGMRDHAEALKRSFSEAFNLGLLIGLFIFINAMVGKQLFGLDQQDSKDEDYERLNFNTFQNALFTVFVAMTGKWIGAMRATMEHNNKGVVAAFFVQIMLLGNFMLLNLFLAILLNHVD